MPDVDLLVRGVTSTSTLDTSTVSSHAATAVGDWLLVIALVDYRAAAELTITTSTGVQPWGNPVATTSNGGVYQGKAWLARVTTGGARAVTVAQAGNSSGLHLHVFTLNPSGGDVTVDGTPSAVTVSASPTTHPAVDPAGTRSVLVAAVGAVQFSAAFTFGAAPSGMTQGAATTIGGYTGAQSVWQSLTAAGSTGARAQSWTPSSANGAGLMLALRAQTTGGVTHQGSATIDAAASIAADAFIPTSHPAAASTTADVSLVAGATVGVAAAVHVTAAASLDVGTPGRDSAAGGAVTAAADLTVLTPQQIHAATADFTAAASITLDPTALLQASALITAPASMLTAGWVEKAEIETPRGYQPVETQPTRLIAQDIRTKKFLHWDLGEYVNGLTITWALSGPTQISGSFEAEISDLADLGLEAWGTWLYVEEDGQIRAAAILQPAGVDEGETLSLDAVGISSYPKGIPYMGNFTLEGVDVESGQAGVGLGLDPADIVRDIWREVQSYPDGALGVTVRGDTPVRLGTPKQEVSYTADTAPTTPDGVAEREQVDYTAGPYSALDWWEAKDCASEIETLARDTPFDWVERCSWNADKTDVVKWIEIGYPRIGSRVTARFVEEENMAAAPGPEEPDDRWASEVIVLGKGEGSGRVRGRAARPWPNRVRRVKTVDDKTIDNNTKANQRAAVELARCQAIHEIPELTAFARHDNASIGHYTAGDDVIVDADAPWYGRIQEWHRVTALSYTPAAETVHLNLRLSSAFDN